MSERNRNGSKAVIKEPSKLSYEFGPFCLVPAEHTLLRRGQPVPLTPKVFEILKVLVENSGHLVEKEELMKAVWPDSFVEEGNLARNISSLRTALGESADDRKYIETVPKRGYRFVALVRERNGSVKDGVDQSPSPGTTTDLPQTVTSVSYRAWAIVALATVAAVLGYALFFRHTVNAREPQIKSLAVLPVKSVAGDADEAGVRRGLTETIITSVNQINGLIVRSAAAVKKYDKGDNSLNAGRQLQVDFILELTIQHSGDHYRVNSNLLRTVDGVSLWSDTFDRDLTDIYKLHDEVAQHVATRLRLNLPPQSPSNQRAINAEANKYYWLAKLHTGTENRRENEAAIDFLERAVAADPDFAEAYAALALEYHYRGIALRPEEKEKWEATAFEAIDHALRLDPQMAEAHVVRGFMLWNGLSHFRHEQAIGELRRGLDLDPNYNDAHHQLGSIYNHIGLLDKAQIEIQKAIFLDPTNVGAQFRVGVNLLYQSRYEDALSAFRESRKYNPPLWSYQVAHTLFDLGKKDQVAATIAEARSNAEQDEGGLLTSMEAMLAAAAGDTAKAQEKIKQAAELGKNYIHFHHTEYAIASAYALMGKRAESIRWLQRTADDGFPCYPMFERDPNLNDLRQDPSFIAFMAKLKEQWEHYKATL